MVHDLSLSRGDNTELLTENSLFPYVEPEESSPHLHKPITGLNPKVSAIQSIHAHPFSHVHF
jgi:hypothetical protein